jgi:MFS superfamily sulfate permease-like transporter
VGDAVAGLTVSVVLVPQASAYALLADLSPVYGLYTSFAPLLVFAAFTSSRHTSIGPFALMSIVTSALARDVLGRERDHDPHLHLQTVLCITVVAGALQVVMGLLGAGLVASFLSDPAVAGFTTAAALIIASSQLTHSLGVRIPRGNLASTLLTGAQLVWRGEANAYCAALTLSALAMMLGLKAAGKRWCARIPLFEQLLAVMVFTALAEVYALPVPRVGDNGPLPHGLPPLRVATQTLAIGGAAAVVGTMRAHGAVCCLASGGFTFSPIRISKRCASFHGLRNGLNPSARMSERPRSRGMATTWRSSRRHSAPRPQERHSVTWSRVKSRRHWSRPRRRAALDQP